jgi:hypothetical protein
MGSIRNRSKTLLMAFLNVIVSLSSPSACMLAIWLAIALTWEATSGRCTIFRSAITSAAVKARPSWKVTPLRSVKVTVLPSADRCHAVASSGFGSSVLWL